MAKFITIASFTGPLEAHIAKGRLETEGVPAFIAHEHHIWAAWFLSNALGGVKIQVLATDHDKAKQIMDAHINGEYEEDLKQEFTALKDNACLKCSSTNFTSILSRGLLSLDILFLGLLGIIFPLQKNTHICQHCNHKWKD